MVTSDESPDERGPLRFERHNMKTPIKLLVVATVLGSSLFTTACTHRHYRHSGHSGHSGMHKDRDMHHGMMDNRWKSDRDKGRHKDWRGAGDRRW